MTDSASLCLSAKPHRSQPDRPIASRQLLRVVGSRLGGAGLIVHDYDLRTYPLPPWAGVDPSQLDDPGYTQLAAALCRLWRR